MLPDAACTYEHQVVVTLGIRSQVSRRGHAKTGLNAESTRYKRMLRSGHRQSSRVCLVSLPHSRSQEESTAY